MEEPGWLAKTEGYIDLGMLDEAWKQLDSLPDELRDLPEAIEMRITILLDQKDTEDALRLCLDLCRKYPDNHAGFIQGAFCLHHMGLTEQAQQHLQSGPPSLRREPTYFYNLCCYNLSLGKKDSAMAWLNRAFEMSPGFVEEALNDPDLESIHPLIEKRLNRQR